MSNIRRGMMAAAGAAGGAAEYQLWSWGQNSSGELGNDGAPYSQSSPVQIGDNFFGELDLEEEGIIAIQDRIFTSGTGASAAVKGDGTLWTWGYNTTGKLGLGDTTNRSVPVQVGSLTDWRSVCGTGVAMCATKTDGTLWGWGKGDADGHPECSGQGDTISSPVQIGSDTDWSTVLSCNLIVNKSVLGLKTTGIMYMWGSSVSKYFSQGGFNDTVAYSGKTYCRLPQRPGNDPEGGNTPDDKNYVTAGCGKDSVWAIDNTGKLWAWGVNLYYGPLGLGDTTSVSSPVQVGSATDWTWASGNQGRSQFAAKSNGEVYAAGSNDAAEFGLDAEGAHSSPVQVGGPGGWQSGGHGLAAGTLHTITDANGDNTGGALWACGTGGNGVRGDGVDGGVISSPVQIGSDTTWVALSKQGSIGTYWKLAIKKAG